MSQIDQRVREQHLLNDVASQGRTRAVATSAFYARSASTTVVKTSNTLLQRALVGTRGRRQVLLTLAGHYYGCPLPQKSFCFLRASVHMILRHNAMLSAESVSVGNTELRPILSNWEGVRYRSLRIRTSAVGLRT